MGGCLSTSTWSTHSSQSTGENAHTCCMGIGSCSTKRTCKTFSDHVISLNHLASIPNRFFTNGKSRTSCIYTQQGRKGVNQDAMIVWEDFLAEDVTFCGVFDGHGPHGHLVARKVRDSLPIKLLSFLLSRQSKQNTSRTACFKNMKESNGDETEKNGSAEDTQNSLYREAFIKGYKAMDKELKSHPNMDCFCSGSTAVTLIKQGANLFLGYIGDSRAILGAKDSNDSMVAIQLSVDLKPDLPREAERIKHCKGRIFALQDEPEVPRVWLPFDNAPGLAMARAFGDFCLKEYGVISIPEFCHRVLTENDQFIVLASDGVWDVLSNEEVVQIVSSASNRSSSARILVDCAAREWKLKYPTSRMDDCAVVCLFLDSKMDADSDYDEPGYSSATLQSNHSGNAFESDDGQKSEPCLHRNFTIRSSDEIDSYGTLPVEREGDRKMETGKDQYWLGLDGVNRVNSLVQLPRFSEEDPAA